MIELYGDSVTVPIDDLIIKPEINTRPLDIELVDQYAQDIKAKQINDADMTWQFAWREYPQCTKDLHLFGGFHTVEAARVVFGGQAEITLTVRGDNYRDAYFLATGENAAHGRRRTSEEKRRAVLRWLEDEEGKQWTDNYIALQCKVSSMTVSRLADELSQSDSYERPTRRKYIMDDKEHWMDTEHIGNKPDVEPDDSGQFTVFDQLDRNHQAAEYARQLDKLKDLLEPYMNHKVEKLPPPLLKARGKLLLWIENKDAIADYDAAIKYVKSAIGIVQRELSAPPTLAAQYAEYTPEQLQEDYDRAHDLLNALKEPLVNVGRTTLDSFNHAFGEWLELIEERKSQNILRNIEFHDFYVHNHPMKIIRELEEIIEMQTAEPEPAGYCEVCNKPLYGMYGDPVCDEHAEPDPDEQPEEKQETETAEPPPTPAPESEAKTKPPSPDKPKIDPAVAEKNYQATLQKFKDRSAEILECIYDWNYTKAKRLEESMSGLTEALIDAHHEAYPPK